MERFAIFSCFYLKCWFTTPLGDVVTIHSAFKSPHELLGDSLLGFSWGWFIDWADQQNVAHSCSYPWPQLDRLRDHLTPKASGVGTSVALPLQRCQTLQLCGLQQWEYQLWVQPSSFLWKAVWHAIKIEGENMSVQSCFCFCESAGSNGSWSG